MTDEFPEVKHLVFDEIQCFTDEGRDWLSKARRIVRQHSSKCEDVLVGGANLSLDQDLNSCFNSAPNSYPNMNLDQDTNSDDGQGFLWLFIDNCQVKSFLKTGVPPVNKQYPFCTLKKVIRNSKSIFDEGNVLTSTWNFAQIGHDFIGGEVEKRGYAKGEQLVKLKAVLESLFEEGYSQGEVAVLYKREESIESIRDSLCFQLNLNHIVDAKDDHLPFVLVSSLSEYSGLERPVVILVDFVTLENSLDLNARAFLYCAITRAMVKLILLDEMGVKYNPRMAYYDWFETSKSAKRTAVIISGENVMPRVNYRW